VATFRSDEAYIDGRHPTAVRFSSPEEDAKRRDFTVNGMFYDPAGEEVIDFVGGRADIGAKLVRAIGDAAQRFAEDRLRMLRAVRFATVLDYKIDNGTWQALLTNASSINQISAERIRDELVRILTSPNRGRGWDLLDASGLMSAVLSEVVAMKGCRQPEQFHPEGDVFQHTRLMLEFLPEKVSVPLVFSVVLHDVAKPRTATIDKTGRIRFSGHDRMGAEMTEGIMRRLRFSGAEIEATVEMVRQHMVFKDVPKMRVAKLKRFMARPTFEDELELHRVDCEGSHRMLDNYEFLLRKREEFATEPIIPPPFVRGDDLIALGLKPGPKFGEILEAVETQQLEGKVRTREEALAWVKREYALGRTALKR
jgi:tRNA nucleotidyltransferase/poly(A) polymerase